MNWAELVLGMMLDRSSDSVNNLSLCELLLVELSNKEVEEDVTCYLGPDQVLSEANICMSLMAKLLVEGSRVGVNVVIDELVNNASGHYVHNESQVKEAEQRFEVLWSPVSVSASEVVSEQCHNSLEHEAESIDTTKEHDLIRL